ncbi:FadR/GntR family transcriptional regulator [Ochrobactrum sp. EDr1-4]|uniref:FadR/GntR family transcriptional regulator n=1 Tax=Ochrobactrum sp. EDr1-4 TaxID=3368622 RepID=UPI003BA2E78E
MSTPLVELTVQKLREYVSTAKLTNDHRLPAETVLANELGVSRPVLRDALSILKSEGIIEARRGSGNFAKPDPAAQSEFSRPKNMNDLESCLRFRVVIECSAAEEAAARRDDKDIAFIAATIDAMQTGGQSAQSIAETDLDFHLSIARATKNPYYAMTLQFLRPDILFGLELGRQLRSVPTNVTSKRVKEEHLLIFDAIRLGEPAQANARMRQHLTSGIERLFGTRSW